MRVYVVYVCVCVAKVIEEKGAMNLRRSGRLWEELEGEKEWGNDICTVHIHEI